MQSNQQVQIKFAGTVRSVQPRSNVWRYRLDNRNHGTTGYNLFLTGTADGEERDFVVAISEKQQEKFCCRIGDEISGTAGRMSRNIGVMMVLCSKLRIGVLSNIRLSPKR